jgi:hypothetical protein
VPPQHGDESELALSSGDGGSVSSSSNVAAKLAEGVAKTYWPSHSKMKSLSRFRRVGVAGGGVVTLG